MTDGYLILTKIQLEKLIKKFKKAGKHTQVKVRIERDFPKDYYWYLVDNGSCD